ncbi:peroxiredoxin-like family protein [Palleronia sp. LCG004]|uniref:peroxiredoxin-like family protein n=1 Tax=Palleronia sp. LCG004 TaxID=3079304 RepID=UPI002943B679|nr:peroxiredoxin-like family protein [Palleronia sp. LCG004]WOI57096.1 peroxiredoxin-like family protein [Palleronia sp. LCG004]
MPSTPIPGKNAPDLDLRLIIGTDWSLKAQSPDAFSMIVFFRGLHCPICKSYLKEIAAQLPTLTEKGVAAVTVSMESEDRAKEAHSDWDLGDLPMAWGLTEEQAHDWGLYLSEKIKDGEPDLFCEPALFLVKPDGTLYLANISNMPFARPPIGDLVDKIDFVIEKDYPARGTHAA